MRIKDRPEYNSKLSPLMMSPETKVAEAVKIMSENNFGSILVGVGDRVDGIVTERDLMRRLLAANRDQNTTMLKEIMTSNLRFATENDNVYEWLRQMSNERFRHLPIKNSEGKVVKMMSQGDFVSYTWPELIYSIRSKISDTFYGRHPILIISFAILFYSIIMSIIVNIFSKP